jgi:hypothetical protein
MEGYSPSDSTSESSDATGVGQPQAREACIVVTIVDGMRNANCRGAAANVRPMLERASLGKFKLYGPLLNSHRSTLYPAPFDQFGATSQDVHALVAALAQRQAANSADGTTRRAALTRAQCISRCRQALSMTLQHCI